MGEAGEEKTGPLEYGVRPLWTCSFIKRGKKNVGKFLELGSCRGGV